MREDPRILLNTKYLKTSECTSLAHSLTLVRIHHTRVLPWTSHEYEQKEHPLLTTYVCIDYREPPTRTTRVLLKELSIQFNSFSATTIGSSSEAMTGPRGCACPLCDSRATNDRNTSMSMSTLRWSNGYIIEGRSVHLSHWAIIEPHSSRIESHSHWIRINIFTRRAKGEKRVLGSERTHFRLERTSTRFARTPET